MLLLSKSLAGGASQQTGPSRHIDIPPERMMKRGMCWVLYKRLFGIMILYLYKAHQRMYFSFWIFTLQGAIEGIFRFPQKLPHYLSSFASLSGTKPQKLPIISKNNFSFDRIFLRCLLTPLWVKPIRFA